MVDRLGEADIEQLIEDFAAGTPKRELAERYGISESSVSIRAGAGGGRRGQ